MIHYQNIGAVAETVRAEMERPGHITDMSDASSDDLNDLDETATTSVEELLGVIAELSERVMRLERAMVMLLAEKHANAPVESVQSRNEPPQPREEQRAARVPEPARAAPPRPVPPRGAQPPVSSRPVAETLTTMDFDLPSHQWGAEGLTDKSYSSTGPLTPIQHSDYPEISVPAEDAATPAPKRTGSPERVIVRAAIEGYPHIIESICLMWGGREADAYLSRLVIDTRGGRKGFPRDVMDELLILAEVCTIKSGLKPDFTPFDRDRAREREG
jgi:hypothetical protein